jgi:hypothetical protein
MVLFLQPKASNIERISIFMKLKNRSHVYIYIFFIGIAAACSSPKQLSTQDPAKQSESNTDQSNTTNGT